MHHFPIIKMCAYYTDEFYIISSFSVFITRQFFSFFLHSFIIANARTPGIIVHIMNLTIYARYHFGDIVSTYLCTTEWILVLHAFNIYV